MSDTWPKVIRDPVHDIILFDDSACDRLLLKLINTLEFQRLRRIKQLGMSELVFPGANHSRFSHSIGVMNTAKRILNQIEKISGEKLPKEHRVAVLAASLLHDIGHGPFSHTFEKVSGEDHEARTLEVIQDSSTEVHKRLSEHDRKLPDILAAFFEEDPEESRDAEIPPYLTQVVSSQLDADRFDYLLRDSYATGANYGRFDLNWIIEHLYLDNAKKRFYLSHKSLMAAETYVFARYHMYRTVYFHKTTRSAEVMLRLLFKRYKQLLDNAESSEAKRSVVPHAPPAILEAFSTKMSLATYLALDDHAVSEFLRACNYSNDETLKMLGAGLLGRKLYKVVEATEAQSHKSADFNHAAIVLLKNKGIDTDYFFAHDEPGDIPYKPYDPDVDQPAMQIYVENTLGEIKEISKLSGAIQQLTSGYDLLRFYFPESLRDEMDALAKDILRKDKK